MSEAARSEAPANGSGLLAWWAHHSHRYVLPVVGGSLLAIGGGLAFDPPLLGHAYAPAVLAILGAGALATGLASHAVRRPASVATPPPARSAPSESWVVCPSCNARTPEREGEPGPRPWWESQPPASFIAPGPADPADLLWGTWVPSVGRMPVDLIGPVPETAFVLHRAGFPRLYEEGEPVIARLPSEKEEEPAPPVPTSAPAPESYGPVLPLTEEELEDWACVPVAVPAAPAIVGASALPSLPALPAPTGVPETLGPVWHEAINPTPPHRRPARAAHPPAVKAAPAVSVAGGVVGCANCRLPVRDPKGWRRCTECGQQLCGKCMTTTFLTIERAWCARCAELRSLDGLESELAPRTRRTHRSARGPVPTFPALTADAGALSASDAPPA